MSRTAKTYGSVIGSPGGSLDGATWAKNDAVARTGAKGETKTAQLLDKVALQPGGPTVMHDLEIRSGHAVYNIDHVVISGDRIWLVDSKCWAQGLYYTIFGRTFRGAKRFEFADKKTMQMAAEHLSRRFGVTIAGSVVAVWPSSRNGSVNLTFASNPFSKIFSAERAVAYLSKRAKRPADPTTVRALMPLVVALHGKNR